MSLPPVPASFYWTSESWGAALKCRPLEAVAPHLFTTRQLEFPSRESWQKLALSLSVASDRFVSVSQVHGNQVVVVRRGTEPDWFDPSGSTRPNADALVSDAADMALVVRAADCVPLLMADRRSGAVAAVHAGWRGTAARVAVAAIECLAKEFNSRTEDLVVAIGPAIGSCCYEVGTDVVDAFAAAGHERYLIDRWFVTPPVSRGALSSIAGRSVAKLRLDVPGANRDQLVLAGVPEADIHMAGLCTAMHLDVLTSFRAEKERAGRIVGVIRSRSNAADAGNRS